MIRRTSLNKLFELGAKKLKSMKEAVMTTLQPAMRRVLETVADFGNCVLKCFVQKNNDGFCFDKKKCVHHENDL
jgi:hypothetical protein